MVHSCAVTSRILTNSNILRECQVYPTHLKHIWSLKKDLCREIFEEDVTEELTGFRHKWHTMTLQATVRGRQDVPVTRTEWQPWEECQAWSVCKWGFWLERGEIQDSQLVKMRLKGIVLYAAFLLRFLKYMHIDHQNRFFAAKITIKHFFRSLVPSHLSLDTGSESTYKHYMHMLIIFHQIYSQFYTNGTSPFVWKWGFWQKRPQKNYCYCWKKVHWFFNQISSAETDPHMEFLNLQYMEKKVFKTFTIIKWTMSRHYTCAKSHTERVSLGSITTVLLLKEK